MSDPKRATLITVGATKSEKNKVHKTVRLTINLDESNESKYPELNYKELVIAEERKKRVQNGKTGGLDPFSDNDDDVERVARKFEQKYGGKSTYGRKGRSKRDDFADIGAGYDENDSFIDNTDGYDEMIPPECDTFYGGFYINSGSLEFKNVENASLMSDEDPAAGRRNKRRISSSSSEEDSSDSSSESESQDEKEPKVVANGAVDSHKTEHRKKKNKNIEKKAKKVRRADSSAATSGKQTSDEPISDNNHGDSADSRTSQSDSLTSKPAPSSENPITSDSSRDVEAKIEAKLPAAVAQALEELETAAARPQLDNNTARDLDSKMDPFVLRLERSVSKSGADTGVRKAVWARAARALHVPRTKLLQRARTLAQTADHNAETAPQPSSASQPAASAMPSANNKRKNEEDIEDLDVARLTEEEREAKIVDTLQRLKALIEERKPAMMANYKAECDRVQEERKKIQIASAAEGAPVVEKRLPKRRFPWCPRSRALLSRLKRLAAAGAGGQEAAAILLAKRALPLFPSGFVRMPTLLRQADLSKELKAVEMKRQRLGSASQPTQVIQPVPSQQSIQFTDNIHFPSSLTVTTMKTPTEKIDTPFPDDKEKFKSSIFGTLINSFSLSKDLLVEKQEERKKDSVIVEKPKEEMYIPPNNIGSITITPVPNNKEKTVNNVSEKNKEPLLRVKSPAALNEMVNKKEKDKALDNIHKREKDKHKKDKNHSSHSTHANVIKEKRIDTPLVIDTSYQPKQKDLREPTPSPKSKFEEISQRQIESMRIAENNIPRPALVPVHHSPTFIKPDKRPPEVKKKKDIVILSDIDPLGDQPEPVAVIDDSSSDVEVVEDSKCEKRSESEPVPSKDKVREVNHKSDSAKQSIEQKNDRVEEATKEDFDSVMKNLRDLEHSQEASKFNNSNYGGVITSAKREKCSSQPPFNRGSIFGDSRSDKDKLMKSRHRL